MDTRHDQNDIDLRHLRTFVGVVDRGGFGAAARELGLSQSAVSQTLALMETRLGGRLLDRGRPPRPTPLGTRLLRHARATLALVQAMNEDLRQAAATLTLGLPPSLLASRAPAWGAELRRRLPAIRVSFRFGTPAELRRLMDEGHIDAAVLPPSLVFPGETSTPLPGRSLVLAGPPALIGAPLETTVAELPLWGDDDEDVTLAIADPVLGPLLAASPPSLASGAAEATASRSGGLALVDEGARNGLAVLHVVREARPLVLATRADDDRRGTTELRLLVLAGTI